MKEFFGSLLLILLVLSAIGAGGYGLMLNERMSDMRQHRQDMEIIRANGMLKLQMQHEEHQLFISFANGLIPIGVELFETYLKAKYDDELPLERLKRK